MLDFWGWLIEGERPRCVRRGVRRVSPLNRLACPMRDGRGGCRSFREWLRLPYPSMPIFEARSDVGRQAFIDSQNWSFKGFLKELLDARKITEPQLVQEAETLIADHSNSIFNYGTELLRMASAGRCRLAGGDALQAATEAAGRMWEKLWRPESYAGGEPGRAAFPCRFNAAASVAPSGHSRTTSSATSPNG